MPIVSCSHLRLRIQSHSRQVLRKACISVYVLSLHTMSCTHEKTVGRHYRTLVASSVCAVHYGYQYQTADLLMHVPRFFSCSLGLVSVRDVYIEHLLIHRFSMRGLWVARMCLWSYNSTWTQNSPRLGLADGTVVAWVFVLFELTHLLKLPIRFRYKTYTDYMRFIVSDCYIMPGFHI